MFDFECDSLPRGGEFEYWRGKPVDQSVLLGGGAWPYWKVCVANRLLGLNVDLANAKLYVGDEESLWIAPRDRDERLIIHDNTWVQAVARWEAVGGEAVPSVLRPFRDYVGDPEVTDKDVKNAAAHAIVFTQSAFTDPELFFSGARTCFVRASGRWFKADVGQNALLVDSRFEDGPVEVSSDLANTTLLYKRLLGMGGALLSDGLWFRIWGLHVGETGRLMVLWTPEAIPDEVDWPGPVEHFIMDDEGHEQTPWPGVPARRLIVQNDAAA